MFTHTAKITIAKVIYNSFFIQTFIMSRPLNEIANSLAGDVEFIQETQNLEYAWL